MFLFVEMLQKREEKIEQEKVRLGEEVAKSRYVPVKIRKVMAEEYGNKCAIPACHRPSRTLHHTQRFSLAHTHDPRYLAPLCPEHHTLAHSIDRKFQEKLRAAVSG